MHLKKGDSMQTTYSKAVKWLHGDIVLCNNVPEIDESVWNNFTEEVCNEDGYYDEVYQWFITSYDEDDVKWLTKNFDLLFTYSEKLDCWILAVTHLGTSWDYVPCDVKTKDMQERIKEMHFTYKELTK